MPNGFMVPPASAIRINITLEEYLQLYVDFINEMVDYRAISTEDAERYNEMVRDYFQRLYPGREEIRRKYVLDPQTQVSLQQLPFFRQVVAPVVYQNEAIRKAGQYGYTEDDPQYATLLRNAIDAGEEFQRGYVNEWLDYRTATAERDVTAAKGARRAELEKEVAFFHAGQRQLQALREGATLEAERRAEAWETQRQFGVAPGRVPEPTIPTGEPAVREFLEKERPAGMQEFIRGELPGVLEQFEREQAGARRAWWGEIQRPDYEQALQEAEFEEQRWLKVRTEGLKTGLGAELKVKAAELGRPLTSRDVMPSEWMFLQAPERLQAASRRTAELRGYTPAQMARMERPREEPEDPLKAYLAQYPWSAEFMKLAPSQRGFYPSRFAPSARWFT